MSIYVQYTVHSIYVHQGYPDQCEFVYFPPQKSLFFSIMRQKDFLFIEIFVWGFEGAKVTYDGVGKTERGNVVITDCIPLDAASIVH